jgi:ankyrin repeat protein
MARGSVTGWTAMHEACRCGEVEVLKELLLLGVDIEVDVQDKTGRSPLFLACEKINNNNKVAQEEIVQMLLDHGANPNQVISHQEGGSPLHHACTRHLGVAQLLLDAGADILCKTNVGDEHSVRTIGDKLTAIQGEVSLLAKETNESDFRRMVTVGIALEVYETRFLILLTRHVTAIAKGIAAEGSTLQLLNAFGSSELCVPSMLRRRNDQSHTIPDMAELRYGITSRLAFFRICAAVFLHLAEASLVQSLRTCAGRGDMGGFLDAMERLSLEPKVSDLNAKAAGSTGCTPLHCASRYGHLDITAFLIDDGADILAEMGMGETPLGLASRNGYLDVVQDMLRRLLARRRLIAGS